MSDYSKPFKITIPTEEFENLRNDHQFKKILRLARFVNQLAFCLSAVTRCDAKDISYNRQYGNSLLFMSAILFEGLRAYDRLNSDFGNTKLYRAGSTAIFNDPSFEAVLSQLDKTRDKLTFHVDLNAYKDTLKWVKFDEYVFLKGSDGRADNINFALADDLALNYLAGNEHGSDEAQFEYLQGYIDKIQKFVTLFLRHSNNLLAQYAIDKKWPMTELPQE